MKKYRCSEDFFSQNNPESFYWAGFIAAGGCVVNSSGKIMKLALAHKDRGHIEKLKSAVDYSGKIHKTSWRGLPGSYMVISSGKIFDDLERFNIVPRKTKKYTFPRWLIKHPLVDHFMRGYFDGDGTFYIHKRANRKTNQMCFGICGNKSFIEVYKSILETQCDIKIGKIRDQDGLFSITCDGNKKVAKIYKFLYGRSKNNIRLDRKFDLAKSFLSKIRPYVKEKKVIGVCDGKELFFNSVKDTKNRGFTPSAVAACCRGERKSHKGFEWRFRKRLDNEDITG